MRGFMKNVIPFVVLQVRQGSGTWREGGREGGRYCICGDQEKDLRGFPYFLYIPPSLPSG